MANTDIKACVQMIDYSIKGYVAFSLTLRMIPTATFSSDAKYIAVNVTLLRGMGLVMMEKYL